MDLSSDRDLALHSRDGDTQAFGELVRRYQATVFNVCYRLLAERREAEDLAQEAFIRAYQRLDTYDVERPFGPWVRRVAMNLCLNRLQARPDFTLPLDDERDSSLFSSSSENPEVLLVRQERTVLLRNAILSLPAHYRTVVELRHFHNLSYAEIAAQLKIPLSDVKSHLYRARRSLQEKLRAYA